ncbi:MAG TPA: hypothetical protein PK360_06365, partial [bacterium]|nr:hypothetical protein [bacterium]
MTAQPLSCKNEGGHETWMAFETWMVFSIDRVTGRLLCFLRGGFIGEKCGAHQKAAPRKRVSNG